MDVISVDNIFLEWKSFKYTGEFMEDLMGGCDQCGHYFSQMKHLNRGRARPALICTTEFILERNLMGVISVYNTSP